MDMEKMVSFIKDDCNGEELEYLNKILQEARLEQHRKHYDSIAEYIGNAFEKAGEAGFGMVISDSYSNDVTLYPSELANSTFNITVFHKADKSMWGDELGIDLTEGEEE